MVHQKYWPRADSVSQRFDDDFAGIVWDTDAEKACIHTTEGLGWPPYEGGATAPTFTAFPRMGLRRVDWRQHFPANMSVRALQNDRGGVETNKDKVIQLEIVGTCDPGLHEKQPDILYTPEAPDWFLEELAEWAAWCAEEWGIPLVTPSLWLHYGIDSRAPGRNPASYGNSPARMSGPTFNAFRGFLGHQHVAENDHGDPGVLNVAQVMGLAKRILIPTPVNQEDDMRLARHGGTKQWFVLDASGKRKLSEKSYNELKAKGVPDMGDCSAVMLSEFPTFDETSSEAGQDLSDETAALVPVTAQIRALQEQQADMNAKLDELLAGTPEA